ncbi:MAG: arginase family protein [Mycobacterium sp.]|nr:arginase family protein [Mycobacterium sp.]
MDESSAGPHLRVIWGQWQGAGASVVRDLTPELPFDAARRGYAVGAQVLAAVLPPHDGPTVTVPVCDSGDLAERDGIEAKSVVLDQLAAALRLIDDVGPARITTLGGECSVSVAPFSALAQRYGQDLAVVWIDSHPDVDTGETGYAGYHAMAVSALTGHGDVDVLALLPATVAPSRLALVGLHAWEPDAYPHVADWGLSAFGPEQLRTSSAPLLDWLAATGCSKVAIHFDVDVVDSNEVVLGLGAEPDGLTSAQVRRIVADVQGAADVVGLTIAEFIPRQVIQMQQILDGMPLL